MWSELLLQTYLIYSGKPPRGNQQNWISWSRMPAYGLKKQLTVEQPEGSKGGFKIQPHILSLSGL